MNRSQGRAVALGFSAAAAPLLRRLEQSALVHEIRWPGDGEPESGRWLAQRWGEVSAVVAVGACGLVTRLIAPLLGDKNRDPSVVVVDPEGRFAIPLLGGHAAGGERLSEQIAALLGGQAVLTGASGTLGRLALDSFGSAWGWKRGAGDWNPLMARAAAGQPIDVMQESGLELWRQLPAAEGLQEASGAAADGPADLVVSHRRGGGCRWHPPCLWLGIGCERSTSLELLERHVENVLQEHGLAAEAVAGLASIDRKGDEPALLALAERRDWPLKLFQANQLAAVPVPNPSAAVAREMGTASVAEAAALLAAGGPDGDTAAMLLVPKRIATASAGERGAATLAVAAAPHQWAPRRGALHLVGSGPGALELLTGDARRALASATVWVGYGLYLDLLEPLRRPDQLRREGRLTEERQRCAEALELAEQGLNVALISSGDSGIYGMAGLALELWLTRPAAERPAFAVHPGISALQLAAARAGAPLMHDFCTISLSDRLTPWEVIERRLRAAAAGDFVVALYNPRSQGRDWQLARARELLLEGRPATTPVLLARQLGREGERLSLHELGSLPVDQVDMLTLVLVGSSSSRCSEGGMLTPRGYPGAELG
ncbi:MAG: precorrin-3B C(17)-methyltransferase [Cyanobium sp.]